MATQAPFRRQMLGNYFVFAFPSVDGSQDGVTAVDLTAPAPNGLPQLTALTAGFAVPGTRVKGIARVPGRNQAVIVAEIPGEAQGNIFADLYAVDLKAPANFRRVTVRNGAAALEDDIDELVILGRFAVFTRASTPDRVWTADVDRSESETIALPSEQANKVAIEGVVDDSKFDLVTQVQLNDPAAVVVERVLLAVRTIGVPASEVFTNLFALKASEQGLVTTRLSNNFVYTDGAQATEVRLVKGDRVVYSRRGLLSARLDERDSEIGIVTTAISSVALFENEGQGARDHVFYVANGDLFSARVDVAETERRSTRQITAVLPGETIQVLFNTDDRVVFAKVGAGGTALLSAPIAPDQPESDRVSGGTAGVDRLRLAF
jgi:hypothetical protein